MPMPSMTPRLVLAGFTGLLLLGGIAGAATLDPDAEDPAPSEASSPSDTVATGEAAGAVGAEASAPLASAPDAAATTPATASPATTSTRSGQTRTTTTAAARGRSGAPGALVAPRPGGYAYEATTTSPSGGTRTERTTTTVEAAGTEGAATLQAVTVPLDFGGQQALTRNTVAWGGGGAVVRRSIITSPALGQEQLDCTWQPAFAQYASGLAVGKAWSFDTRCAGKIQGIDVVIEQRATRRVTGSATVAGPAGPVATWTIADDTTVVVTSPLGVASVRTVGTQQLAPSLGLPVRSESTVESRTGGPAPERSTVTTKLASLP